MKIVQLSYLKKWLLAISVSFSITLSFVPTTLAYNCSQSGNNSSGKQGQWDLQYENGLCYYMEPDKADNTKRQTTFDNLGNPTGFNCTDGTVKHDDGSCWTYKKTFTDYKPTFDNGKPVPDAVFQSLCEQQPTYYGRHYNYNPSHNACESAGGCWGNGSDFSGDTGPLGGGLLSGQSCRKVGDGTKTLDEVFPDPSNPQNIQNSNTDCSGHGSYDPNTKICTDGSAPKLKEAQGPADKYKIEKTESKCGEARVNIIVCGDKSGNEAITNVLKIILRVLTLLVGAAAVGGMAFASIQYARAADEASVVSGAKDLIRNIIIGVVLYGFMIAIVNWLIPGGVFG